MYIYIYLYLYIYISISIYIYIYSHTTSMWNSSEFFEPWGRLGVASWHRGGIVATFRNSGHRNRWFTRSGHGDFNHGMVMYGAIISSIQSLVWQTTENANVVSKNLSMFKIYWCSLDRHITWNTPMVRWCRFLGSDFGTGWQIQTTPWVRSSVSILPSHSPW